MNIRINISLYKNIIYFLFVKIDSKINEALDTLSGINNDIKTLGELGAKYLKNIDVSEIDVFDLKKASKSSVKIQKGINDFSMGFSKIKFAIGVFAYNLKAYNIFVNANFTMGKQKMDALVKINAAAWYTATRRLHPKVGYL